MLSAPAPFLPTPAPAPEIMSGKNFLIFWRHLMDVYNCAKGHLPKCIINDFMAFYMNRVKVGLNLFKAFQF